MFMTLKREWECLQLVSLDEDQWETIPAKIPAGRHEVERIVNPVHVNVYWLVLKGTRIGGCEGFWRQWSHPKHGDLQVIIEK